jgi:hypothetical protein
MTESVSIMQRRSAVDQDNLVLDDIAAGDEQALHRLYQTHGLPLLNYLIYEMSDRTIAEEVLQDVMLAVWNQAHQFRGNSTVKNGYMPLPVAKCSKPENEFLVAVSL